jgi:Zn-dependent peptidase ImmA (M78 family)/DNA-binding XRE family transcriptional regulator
MFNSQRLKLARERRGLSKKALAELVQLTPKTVSAYESNNPPFDLQDETVARFARELKYPVEFFYRDSIEVVSAETISFRAVSKLPSRLKLATEAASTIAFELSAWLENKFKLPQPDLPDFSHDNRHEPEAASKELRFQWGIGELSVKNMVHLLESKGVRVFSLSEDCKEVDAFSFWKGGTPFVVLNQFKSPERSRFDAAHELAHLVLHRHGEQNKGREAELEADRFASAFLMPKGSIAERVRPSAIATLDDLIKLKKCWNVSLMAMIRRLYDLSYLTEWQYRQLTINASKKGYRTIEPMGLEAREQSLILAKVFKALKEKGFNRMDIAHELALPFDEIGSLTFNNPLFSMSVAGGNPNLRRGNIAPKLSLVK